MSAQTTEIASRPRGRFRPLLPLVLLTLCHCTDSRISVDALRALEQAATTAATPVEVADVEPAQLALTEKLPYKVGPGDVLQLTLMGLTDPTSQTQLRVRVHDDGRINLPFVGRTDVVGKDLAGVESAVVAALVPTYVKQLSVFCELVGPESTTVMVNGAAAQRGLITLPSNERNVLYAVARAGGFVAGTSGQIRVTPARSDRPELAYRLDSIDGLRRALSAPPLESGDLVTIDAAPTPTIYLTGLVNAPGPLPVPAGSSLSAVRALASAGGLIDFLEPKDATLYRRLADGRQVRVKVPIFAMLTGDAPDMELVPGDVLDVPHTADTRFRAWFAQNIRIGPFGVGANASANYDVVSEYRFRRALDEDNGSFRRSVLDNIRFGLPNVIVPPVVTE